MYRFLKTALLIGITAMGASCSDNGTHHAPPPTPRPLATASEWPGVRNAARVSDILYRGGQPTREGFQTLKSMGIKTIVDLRGKTHLDAVDGFGLSPVHIPSNVDKPDLDQVIAFLHLLRDPAKTPVFVHDDLGADRVGLFVAAYRMVEQDWPVDDALAELPQFRFDVYWINVPKFLHHLDVKRVREHLDQMPTSRPAASRPTTRK